MNCLSCDGVLEEVYGQSHHCCRSCNVYQFPNGLDEGLVPITSCGQTTSFLCPKCEVCLEVGSITDSVQVCFCNNCRGFVTSSQSLGQLIAQMRSAYQGPDDRPQPLNPQELGIYDQVGSFNFSTVASNVGIPEIVNHDYNHVRRVRGQSCRNLD